MQEWLINLSIHHAYLVYAITIVLACAEGPVLSMIFGVLIKLGYFSFFPVYAALMVGDLLGDSIWYALGRYKGVSFIKKYGKYVNITDERVAKAEKIFHAHTRSILFISKITTGFGLAVVTLFTAGMVKIPYFKYITTNLLGQFIWSGLLIAVGYFLGQAYTQVDSWLGRITIVAVAVILFLAWRGYRNYIKNRIDKLS